MRTSIGAPRFPLKYSLAGNMSALYPPRHVFQLAQRGCTEAEYTKAYVQHLSATFPTIEVIRDYLRGYATQHQGRALVLLCFCDITQPGAFCHRRIFADWYEGFTGDSIPEL